MTDGTTLKDLAQRLRRLEDMDEIRQLYIDYGRHLDAGDAAAYATLFASDAKLRLGPVMRATGREEIEQVAATVVKPATDGAPRPVHVLSSPRIELTGDGDTAAGECMWTAISLAADGSSKVLVGRHVDELVREDGRWRFARRTGHVDIGALG
jgi:uncharacterized protein (TIGR02246 family)